MHENEFYAVYVVESGQVVAFHNLPLEQIDSKAWKVAFTCEGVSHIIIKDDLSKFNGKEFEFFVQNGELKKKKIKEIKHQKLESEMNNIKNQIADAISMQIGINEELKVTKGFLEWIKEDQPKEDPREKKFTEMQEKIAIIKEKYSNKRTEIVRELAALN